MILNALTCGDRHHGRSLAFGDIAHCLVSAVSFYETRSRLERLLDRRTAQKAWLDYAVQRLRARTEPCLKSAWRREGPTIMPNSWKELSAA
jgi:hypothetical protein